MLTNISRTNSRISKGANKCRFDRSRKMKKTEPTLAIWGVDTAESGKKKVGVWCNAVTFTSYLEARIRYYRPHHKRFWDVTFFPSFWLLVVVVVMADRDTTHCMVPSVPYFESSLWDLGSAPREGVATNTRWKPLSEKQEYNEASHRNSRPCSSRCSTGRNPNPWTS